MRYFPSIAGKGFPEVVKLRNANIEKQELAE